MKTRDRPYGSQSPRTDGHKAAVRLAITLCLVSWAAGCVPAFEHGPAPGQGILNQDLAHGVAAPASRSSARAWQRGPFRLSIAPWRWYGHPVYVLTPVGAVRVLHHVVITNWAEQPMTVLYVGKRPLSQPPAGLPSPPVDVQPGDCVYVAGSLGNTLRMTVFWQDDNGKEHVAVVGG
ncbi:hypothetical protein [Alicyclobacillus cellulosilyticus]|uniref:hypothetical protein n=1 Tax=Alicyclobacillus cellulosilyticus TaxID=1003997 RepID=UPI001662AA08|nr:hypothetical protein [Alicyclobacillus cellulosilyticus]